jgi:sugar phosphate isomerase/epimerase
MTVLPVILSTASVYPLGCAAAFEAAARNGYDGIEVMVWTDPVSQDAEALRALSARYDIPVMAVHAPTLLLTQRVWGTGDPWEKIDRSIDLAEGLGASVVVLHPPFRWQRDYAGQFIDGVARREHERGVALAVENMYPWRARGRELQAYLPGWDPTSMSYDHVTLDLSHTATAGSDAMAMAHALGDRLHHLHLADGTGAPRDEHLVPGAGTQPCGEMLEFLAGGGFAGMVTVEISTRRQNAQGRETDLAQSLAFARLHLAPVVGSGRV